MASFAGNFLMVKIPSESVPDENLDFGEDATIDLSSMIPGAIPPHAGGASPPPPAPAPPAATMEEQGGLVLAGFRDCSEEAIRYLIDVEHISEDDPLILGLKQHLWERQQHLDIERIISEHMCSWSGSASLQEQQQQQQQQQHRHATDQMGGLLLNPYGLYDHSCIDSTNSSMHQSDIQMHDADDELNTSEDSQKSEMNDSSLSSTSTSSSASSTVFQDQSPASSPQITSVISQASQSSQLLPSHCSPDEGESADTDMSQSVLNLALLAQNNPAIASLTEELLSLLGQGQQDSDLDDSDFDFEESQDSD